MYSHTKALSPSFCKKMRFPHTIGYAWKLKKCIRILFQTQQCGPPALHWNRINYVNFSIIRLINTCSCAFPSSKLLQSFLPTKKCIDENSSVFRQCLEWTQRKVERKKQFVWFSVLVRLCVCVCVFVWFFYCFSLSTSHYIWICMYFFMRSSSFFRSHSLNGWRSTTWIQCKPQTNKQISNGFCLSFTGLFNAYYT